MIEVIKNEYQVQEFLNLFLRQDAAYRFTVFIPGKYGRLDYFAVREGILSDQYAVAEINTDDRLTLAALVLLDNATRTHEQVAYYQPGIAQPGRRGYGAVWNMISNKRIGKPFEPAADLYRRRLAEQRRILDGSLRRGSRAFGFYPMDGGA
jgi:hypothetical protein